MQPRVDGELHPWLAVWRSGEVGLAGEQRDRLAQAEVAYGEDAAYYARERSIAAVLHAPDSPAHGRRAVLAARCEVSVGVGGEASQHLLARVPSRDSGLLALAGARTDLTFVAVVNDVQFRQPALLALLQQLEDACPEVARLQLALPRGRRGRGDAHNPRARVEGRSQRGLARLSQGDKRSSLRERRECLLGQRRARERGQGRARWQLDVDPARDRPHVCGLAQHRRRRRRVGRCLQNLVRAKYAARAVSRDRAYVVGG